MNAKQLDVRAIASEDLDVGLRYAERFGDQLRERFICRTVHGWRSERDLERTILDSDDPITTRTRRNADLERDRAILLLNL